VTLLPISLTCLSVLYPDGDVIDLFFKAHGQSNTLSDLGETLRWLRMQTASMRKTPNQRQLIQDVCLNHGIELFKDMLMIRVQPGEEAQAMTRLSQACLRISDLWFTFRSRMIQSVSDEVQDLLDENQISFERNETLVGRSGRIWRPDFHIRRPKRSTLVCVLSTGSRAAARNSVDHTVATWYDINHLKSGQQEFQFLSLFDDSVDVWTPEDIELISSLSEVAYWSNPDDFLEKLAA